MQEQKKEQKGHLSEEEIVEAIEALTPLEYAKLGKVAKYYSWGGLDPNSLLQEAIMRTLEGRRKCRRDVEFIVFLKNAMRSVADSQRNQVIPENDAVFSKDAYPEGMIKTLIASPEDKIIGQETLNERQQYCESTLREIHTLFESDDDITSILMGQDEDLSPQEIRDMWKMDNTTYNSARRRMRRALDKKYPKGWSI